MNELQITLILAGGFLLIFALGEVFHLVFKMPAEITRKFVHLSSGFLTLTFPVFLTMHWYVLALCSSFALILVVSQKYGFLKSINNVERVTRGSYLFPAAIYFSYLMFQYKGDDYLYFFLPVLILAISDPLAALFGKKWPYGKYKSGSDYKSMMGSSVFFISSLGISLLLIYVLSAYSLFYVVMYSVGISFNATVAEALSKKGWDNINIPFAVIGTCLLFAV